MSDVVFSIKELVIIILSHSNPLSVLLMSKINKFIRQICSQLKPPRVNLLSILHSYTRRGNYQLYNYLNVNNKFYPKHIREVIRRGNLDFIKSIDMNHVRRMNVGSFNLAVRYGQLEMAKYIKRHSLKDIKINRDSIKCAVESGSVGILRHIILYSTSTLSVVDILRNNGAYYCDLANNQDMLTFLAESVGCRQNEVINLDNKTKSRRVCNCVII